MNKYINQFKEWFEKRELREKILVTGLSWALIYAIFALILFSPLDQKSAELSRNIKKANDDIVLWEAQMKYLRDIPSSPLYKEWLARHKTYEALKDKYKNILGKSATEKWGDIIKAVLSNYPNIAIESIENSPESLFEGNSTDTKSDDIYKRQAKVSALGNYKDVYGYLNYLETTVPNIHWDSLSYKVTEYPEAKVEMEFSILYEK